MDLKEEMEKIAEHINAMSEEEILTKVLCLNGIMTQELLDEVFSNIIPLTSDGFYPDEENEKHKKFMEVFNYIDTYTEKKYPDKKVDITECFYEHKIDFTYKGKLYRWALLQGQGSVCSIYDIEESDDSFELTLDTSLRYYKRKE